MQSNNNSEEEYREIWASIEPEVKALNRSMHRKRKSRKILFWLMAMLVTGACWLTNKNTAKNSPVVENKINPTALKEINNTLPATTNQEEKCDTINKSNISNQKKSGSTSISNRNTNIESQLNRPLKIAALPNEKTEVTPPLFSNQQLNNFSFKETSPLLRRREFLIKNELTKSTNLKKLPTLAPSFLETKRIQDTINIKPITVPHIEKKWANSLTVSSGFSYIQRQLASQEEASLSVLAYRNATERTLYAAHYGLTYTVKHHSNFKLTSGINYTSMTEAFNYTQTILDTFYVEGIEKIIIHLDGSRTEILGNAAVKKTTVNEYEYFHKYELIEIPLLVGYEKQWKDLKVGCQAGVLTNISLSTKGKRLGSTGTKQEIEQLGYQSRINLGYYAGVALQKNIFRNLALSIEPTLRIYPDIASKENLIRQRYNLYGLNINLTFKL